MIRVSLAAVAFLFVACAPAASAGAENKAPRIVSHNVKVAAGFRVTASVRVCDDSGGNLLFLVSETRLRDGKTAGQVLKLTRTGTRSCRTYVLKWKAKFQPFTYRDYYLVAISARDKGDLYSNAATEYWQIYD